MVTSSFLPSFFDLDSFGLAILIELELGNDQSRSRNAHRYRLTIDLFSGNPLNVHDPLLSVDRQNLAFAGLVHSSGDQDFVVFADGHGTDAVSCLQLLGKISRHELATSLGMGAKVSLARLAAARRNVGVEFHIVCTGTIVTDVKQSDDRRQRLSKHYSIILLARG